MSFTPIIQALKGSARSGNFAHAGRPSKVGGSKPGGGHFPIGVTGDTPTSQIRNTAQVYRNRRDYKRVTYSNNETFFAYQNVDNLPGRNAIKSYTGSDYKIINGCLRKPKDCAYPEEFIEKSDAMDKFFDALPPLKDNIIVQRGIGSGELFTDLQPGDQFEDKGFVSTTIKISPGFSGVPVEIHVPKGSKAAYIEPISKFPSEKELLLNRGAKFKILSIEHDSDGMLNKVVAEYIK